jgi:hypothetical protein
MVKLKDIDDSYIGSYAKIRQSLLEEYGEEGVEGHNDLGYYYSTGIVKQTYDKVNDLRIYRRNGLDDVVHFYWCEPDIVEPFMNSDGIEFKVGDVVTTYSKGYYRVVGFNTVEDVPTQAVFQMIADSNLNLKTPKWCKTCHVSYLKHVDMESEIREVEDHLAKLRSFMSGIAK